MPVLLLLFALIAPSPAHAVRVDRVVAVVESQLVLGSEVRLEQELTQLDPEASRFWVYGSGTDLERLIDAAAIRVAAGPVKLYQPPDEDVRTRREAVRAQFENRKEWQDFLEGHGLNEDSLAAALRRRMVVERFIARNVQVALEDREAWAAATDALVDGLRERMRVRTIPPEDGNRGFGL